MLPANPFGTVDRQVVLGSLMATGSRDPDVLHSARAALLASARRPKLIGAGLVVAGVACTASVTLIGLGPPLLVGGWWLWRRGVRNQATVETVFREFIQAPSG